MSAEILETNAITEISDFMGFSLYYIFQFFSNLSMGYILIMSVFMIGMIILIYFRFIKTSAKRVL